MPEVSAAVAVEAVVAAGTLSIADGIGLSVASLTLGIALAAWLVNPLFVLAVLGYVALTTAYTFALKQKMMVDVLTLATLFTYRVMAGGVAANTRLRRKLGEDLQAAVYYPPMYFSPFSE